MTFNEGMQIDTSSTSRLAGSWAWSRHRDRRWPGWALIVVVALFLGVDPSTVIPQQQQIAPRASRRPDTT